MYRSIILNCKSRITDRGGKTHTSKGIVLQKNYFFCQNKIAIIMKPIPVNKGGGKDLLIPK